MTRILLALLCLVVFTSSSLFAASSLENNPHILKITVIPYLGAHSFPEGSGVGSSPEIGSMFTTPLTDTIHFLFGIGFSQGFKDQSLRSITTTEWGLQFDMPFTIISPYAKSYSTLLFIRDTNTQATQLALGFGFRFFMKKEGKMVLRTETRLLSGSVYRAGLERLAITKRPDWFKPPKPKAKTTPKRAAKPKAPKTIVKPVPQQKKVAPAPVVKNDKKETEPTFYRVIAASLKNQESANNLSRELVQKGYKTYLWRDKESGLYHVQVYFVKDKKQAEGYKASLIKAGYKDTYLRKK